jgi:multiple sugar transport system permease protein
MRSVTLRTGLAGSQTRKQGLLGRVKRCWFNEETGWAYLFLLPMLLHHAVFVVYPVFYAFNLSFHEWNVLSPTMKFVGLNNYIQLLSDKVFLKALANTGIFTGGVLGGTFVFSLAAALAFDRRLRGGNFFRVTYYIPAVTSAIVVATVWSWMYEPYHGVINLILEGVGVSGPNWLGSPNTALLSVTLTAIWGAVGYYAVIYLAGLQGIDETYYEAAKIDGANGWARFRHITLPLLRPTIFYVVVMVLISASQVFGLVYGMTGGGPVNSSSVVVFYLFKQAFVYFKMGYASTVAYVLFAIIFVLAVIQFRVLGKGYDL